MGVVPVILSGGSGTRLWPLSRALFPKQLLPLVSEDSMLQETVKRVNGDGFEKPMVICNDAHRFIVAEQLRAMGKEHQGILLEPAGRNTAPAAAVAALRLAEKNGPDTLMMLLPSDHVVANQAAFLDATQKAVQAAKAGALVTFGIEPSHPETGYGYIKQGDAFNGLEGCFSVARFEEKPNREKAEAFLADGGYHWNSGMFLFSCKSYLDELERLHPAMVAACRDALEAGEEDLDFFRLNEGAFVDADSLSIDYAVMEHTERAVVVPVEMGWNDVGSWTALWDIGEKDSDGNVLQGDVIAIDVSDSYIRSDARLVAATGVKDIIIAVTDDAVLVAGKESAQKVKDLVDRIKAGDRHEHETHTRVYRPWGWYQSLEFGPNFQVKQLSVNPGAQLSLQKHRHRAEHWVVVEGIATVTRDDDVVELAANQSTYIPIGMKHRLENKTSGPLKIIEIQSGDYLGEDDIVRFEDDYGRIGKI